MKRISSLFAHLKFHCKRHLCGIGSSLEVCVFSPRELNARSFMGRSHNFRPNLKQIGPLASHHLQAIVDLAPQSDGHNNSLPANELDLSRAKFKKLKLVCLILYPIALTNLSGCMSLGRSHSSGYYSSAAELDVRRERRHSEREVASTQLGFDARGGLDSEQNEAIELRILLGKAEKTLRGRREHEQYFANKPYMRSDRERLQFLALDSYEERSRWLATRGIFGASTPHSSQVQQLIDVNDIAVGMTKQAVRDSWGEPELVEIAGNPVYGNERWHYTEQVSSTEGFKGELRVVYFESGRVVGWETN